MPSPILRLGAYWSLGPANLARVAGYRAALKAGVLPVWKSGAEAAQGPLFRHRPSTPPIGTKARQDWRKTGLWFSFHRIPCEQPPDWHENPFTGGRVDPSQAWTAVSDFDPAVGDIKAVWEASRFDWLLAMAGRAALGEANELERLNAWLADWNFCNPPYRGANWKCGQEASIRVMHLALAAMLLDQVERPDAPLLAMVNLHLARILPTMSYAVGQQNNHGTSEAAALFIGGSWLHSRGHDNGEAFAAIGRRQLDNQARRLIETDGTFSQYSLVYHRVMLDSYCLAESWRRWLELAPFAVQTLERLQAATRWLRQLTDERTGDGPNLGANDGTRLMGLTEPGYRDFRPTLQWAAALFLGCRAIRQKGPWDQPLRWLKIPAPVEELPEPLSTSFDNGGLHVLRRGEAVAYLRYPRFRFRPSQADALHLDLWVGGENILRDGGTFSYNALPDENRYFSGTESHSTVQFDGRDQMPRIGRFLFGAWLKPRGVRTVRETTGAVESAAGYRDWWGAEHHRAVRLENARMTCADRVSGRARSAILRWRLRPGEWRLNETCVTDGRIRLSIDSGEPHRITLRKGKESLFYLHKSDLPVLEVQLPVPSTVRTIIEFA